MKFNDQFFKPDPVPKTPSKIAESPFRCFNVRCVHCGDLRVILIATFDYSRNEIVVVRRVASKKICECDLQTRRFVQRR